MDQAIAEKHTILRCTVGSTIHGLALDGSGSDRDEMGVMIEPIEYMLRLGESFEQFIHRDAEVREGKHDAPSQAGDLDLNIYSLRKFCRLAAKGNPTILTLLFIPCKDHIKCDARGHQLQENFEWFISREAAGAFLGYLTSQKQRMVGERGQKRCHRPELESKFGYDTKYAMHMLRLGFQGVELMQTGRLALPMRDPDRSYLMQVRKGELDVNAVFTKAGELEAELKDLKETSMLPEHSNREAIEEWMRRMYFYNWSAAMPHAYFDGEKLVDYTPEAK